MMRVCHSNAYLCVCAPAFYAPCQKQCKHTHVPCMHIPKPHTFNLHTLLHFSAHPPQHLRSISARSSSPEPPSRNVSPFQMRPKPTHSFHSTRCISATSHAPILSSFIASYHAALQCRHDALVPWPPISNRRYRPV